MILRTPRAMLAELISNSCAALVAAYTEPGDTTEEEDDGWVVVAEPENAAPAGDEGRAEVTDGEVVPSGVYEYRAVAVIASDASPPSTPERGTYSGAARSSGIRVRVREVTVGDPSFIKGTLYWLGIWSSSTATYRSIQLSNALIIGGIGAAGITTTYGTVIRRTVSFASAAPDPWVFSSGEITNNIRPPQILARLP
jgi:hypothetical protein